MNNLSQHFNTYILDILLSYFTCFLNKHFGQKMYFKNLKLKHNNYLREKNTVTTV